MSDYSNKKSSVLTLESLRKTREMMRKWSDQPIPMILDYSPSAEEMKQAYRLILKRNENAR